MARSVRITAPLIDKSVPAGTPAPTLYRFSVTSATPGAPPHVANVPAQPPGTPAISADFSLDAGAYPGGSIRAIAQAIGGDTVLHEQSIPAFTVTDGPTLPPTITIRVPGSPVTILIA